ncbi:hypothetical protein [Mycobacterium leprae]|uniref:hypothetical protein n=1 Tax=Mycobacterium leprae TaxID=1769 RepID=UPI0002EA3638|nr:hypothetical protein [Mycobacterium leprae]
MKALCAAILTGNGSVVETGRKLLTYEVLQLAGDDLRDTVVQHVPDAAGLIG